MFWYNNFNINNLKSQGDFVIFAKGNKKMKTKQNIIRLIAAMILTVTLMLSLSSCVLDLGVLGELLDIYFSDENNQDNGGEGENNNGGGTAGDNITSENYGEFYPGSGTGSIEGLDPKVRTLLSSVSMISRFGSSEGLASGIIYKLDKEKGDAYILTNYHTVYLSGYGRASSIELYLYGMHLAPYKINATFVGGSVTNDIAVLKVTGSEVLKNSYAVAADLGDSEAVRVFDRVYVVGNAEGMGMAATEGIVNVESETIELLGADNSEISPRVMRVDAAVNHGNSGGGVYDENGRVVGVVVAKEVVADIDNMGYAIPINLAVRIAENVIANCDGQSNTKAQKPLMGITITSYVSGLEISPEGDEIYQVNLVEVIEVSQGSLALGKVSVGDVINSITIDGRTYRVSRVHHVTEAMFEAREGSVVTLNITRGDKTVEVSLTITKESISQVK